MVELIYSSDREVLSDLEEAHEKVEKKKEEVETLQAELKESREVVAAEKEEIAASNEETEKMIDDLQADADRLTQEIASSGSSSSNFHLPGRTDGMASAGDRNGQQTSNFGYRYHPISGGYKMHTGVDYRSSGRNSDSGRQ